MDWQRQLWLLELASIVVVVVVYSEVSEGWAKSNSITLHPFTVAHPGIGTGISEASKRVPILIGLF